ncbi:ankyrin repeat domain containing protein [Euroglyphus maynei]|uniref:Ankyrin repeat domain containing protein n=1 Tax=Euroglyphus maynei TaxID=6958 RepID=A0A1Y3B7B4_EURMA|nr:ankyrin repeat domain containing protein [Euroglyphus maynei]
MLHCSIEIDFFPGCNIGTNNSYMASILSISRHNSQASSINDINYETEQLLEKAIRHNDVKLVSKILELYDDGKNESLDKTSLTAKKSSFSKDEKIERPVLKPQLAIDEQNFSRGHSSSMDDGDNSYNFSNALHLAIENNSFDVFVFLLKHRIDPNNPGKACCQTECFRRSRNTSVDSQDHFLYSNFKNIPSTSCEPLIRSPSIRSANLPLLLNPNIVSTPKMPSFQFMQSNQFSINSEPYNFNSRRSSTKSAKIIQIRSEIPADRKIVHTCSDGTRITYDEEYNREKLFMLPPIFLAVALNNSVILRELIAFGANVNLADGHGVTPLHLCLCQQHISRACLRLLIYSGAKLKTKNNNNVAPIDLVDETFAHEIIQMQKAIIDESFEQLLLRSTNVVGRRDSIPFIKNRKQSKTTLIKTVNNLVSTSERLFLKDNSTDSYTNGTNIAKFFETKIMNNEIKRKNFPFTIKQSSKDATTVGQEDKSPLENRPKNVPRKSITNSATSNSTLFLPTSPGSIGHKRSFAIDSHDDKNSAMKSFQNLSQSTLQLSGDNNIDNNQPQTSNHHNHHTYTSFGARYLFGRRRSGEDNAKNQLKISRDLLSRTTTQDFSDENKNNNNEEIITKRLQDAFETLYKMVSNIECIPKIICCLQKYLPEIVAINEQQNILSILHDSISKLLQKALQTIIENFSEEKKKIFYNKPNHPERNMNGSYGTYNESMDNMNEMEIIMIVRLKQQLASQLCSLIDCAFHCLKSGQTFQYTSLLIINKIIDAFVRYETFDSIELDYEQIYEQNVQNSEKELKKSISIVKHDDEPVENDNDKHTSAAIQFSKHFKHLRLHESFRMKEKNKKHDKSHHIESESEENESIEQCSSSSNAIRK